MHSESLAKAYILTHGVRFTPRALGHARDVNAKRQNMVYNAPASDALTGVPNRPGERMTAIGDGGTANRPQEMFLTGDDGYDVCVSAVAPVPGRTPATVDYMDGRLVLSTPAHPRIGNAVTSLEYVPQPAYYDRCTTSGMPVRRWVSACGYDEMNIWPWHDCAVGRTCSFCGINAVQKVADTGTDPLHALEIRKEIDALRYWEAVRPGILRDVVEAVALAIHDRCYCDEAHLILISGNLAIGQLDTQARVYADLASALTNDFPGRFAEGVVAVTAPPHDPRMLAEMRRSGVETVVFNLEAYGAEAFRKHCPGKDQIGRDHYLWSLENAVEVFGWARSWCNFVLGLEPVSDLLAGCADLASRGITPGANVLHRDYGASADLEPPDFETVTLFYRELATIYRKEGHFPYYCQRALRTSLANEAFAGRLE
jgi:hypothetical protein